MSFQNLGLAPSFTSLLEKENFKQPFPIQEKAIPEILKGKDVLGIAQTGSGKTASYVLPVLSNLKVDASKKDRQPTVLVLVPTRELAEQVKDVFQSFEKACAHPVKTMAIYGGVSINPQMKAIFGVNVIVATPGRLLDLIDVNALQLNKVQTLILDEADKLLNLGFKDEINKVLSLLPPKRQNLLFSATLSEKIEGLHRLLLKNPVTVQVSSETWDIAQIKQISYSIAEEKKGPFLRYLIKSGELNQVLVFTASTYKADNVADKLRKNGIDAKAIHGKKTQGVRNKTLKEFKTGKLRVLVTTDLLARGIDIAFLPYVINYELPRSPKDYVHRIGRTGRAEADGVAISLISPEDEHHFKVIQKKMKVQVERIDGDAMDIG